MKGGMLNTYYHVAGATIVLVKEKRKTTDGKAELITLTQDKKIGSAVI
jgi:hypothetical protein